jgi:hypothetical protein
MVDNLVTLLEEAEKGSIVPSRSVPVNDELIEPGTLLPVIFRIILIT